jgi:hypothetical protein
MCIISLSQPKCCAQRQVCGGLFHHSFINSTKKKHQRRNVSRQSLLEFSIFGNEKMALTYCSQCIKSNGRHWWLRRACATCHQPKCKETLLCEDGDCLSGNVVWLHSDGHCFLVPGTCTESNHVEHIKNKIQGIGMVVPAILAVLEA